MDRSLNVKVYGVEDTYYSISQQLFIAGAEVPGLVSVENGVTFRTGSKELFLIALWRAGQLPNSAVSLQLILFLRLLGL